MSPDEVVLNNEFYENLLRRVKAIRASEKRFYEEIKEIYRIGSYDYDKNSDITNKFYATVQNKLHLAITGLTAAEILFKRSDSSKSNMGLTNWKNAPTGNIWKNDVEIAKNYYTKEEIDELNALVSMYLNYAERQAKLHKPIPMAKWADKLDEFLKFNDYELFKRLKTSPSIDSAKAFTHKQYDKYKNL